MKESFVASHEEWTRTSEAERLRIEQQWLEAIAGRSTRQLGDQLWAFEQVYHAYVEPLHRRAAKWLDSSEALDIVQTIFYEVWKRRLELPPDTTLRSYLYGAVRNRVRNARAAAAVRLRFVTRHNQPDQSSVVDPVEVIELQDEVDRALKTLTRPARLTVLLFYGYSFTRRQVAAILGTSVSAVKRRLTAARPVLIALLGKATGSGRMSERSPSPIDGRKWAGRRS